MGDRLRAGMPSRYVTSQLGQLSFASPEVAKSSTSFGWGNGGNVTSAGNMIPCGMSVTVAVWQLCELLYTCYLLMNVGLKTSECDSDGRHHVKHF